MKIIFKILSSDDKNSKALKKHSSTTIINKTDKNDHNEKNDDDDRFHQNKGSNCNQFNNYDTDYNLNDEPMDVTNCDNSRIDKINAKNIHNRINKNENIGNNDKNQNQMATNFNSVNNNSNNCSDNNNSMMIMNTKEIINLEMYENQENMLLSGDNESGDAVEYQQNLISSKDCGSKRDIASMEVNVLEECNLAASSQRNRMKIALGVLIRLVLPLCNGVARGLQGIRGVRLLKALRNLGASRHMLTNMLAYAANTISMSLSSVQVAYRIDPILKIMKLRKGSTVKSITANSSSTTIPSTLDTSTECRIPFMPSPTKSNIAKSTTNSEESENSVTINILAEPPPGVPIRADIVFIHGLHGSLVNTWKQGLWNSEGRKENFKRPPKPPLRPPKRPRHSRSSIIIPPQLQKRARYTESNSSSVYDSYESDLSDYENPKMSRQLSYDSSSQPDSIQYCDGMEYSFPTFRLRREEFQNDDATSITSTSTSSSTTPINSTTTSPFCRSLSSASETSSEYGGNNNTNDSTLVTETYSKCWPGDWLPLDCPGVRVIALNYTTDPYLWRPAWVRKRYRTSLTERAREMTELLIEKRVGYGHPIVWVGHSKGGIFIKQIIVDAWENGRLAAAPLWRSSRGVFFYSVPHRGSPLADFNLPLLRHSIELIELQKNFPCLLDLHRRFVALYQSGNLKIDVFSFVETALTLMSVLYLRIVGVDSADPGIGEVCGVHLDHREICKPRNRNCALYTELVKMINRVS